jgi:trimethylamine--corrinoid protein Co-methyltransferase
MRLSPAFLSAGDRDRVHRESERILADVGVRFHGERALPLLAAAGAHVDAASGIARIPAGLVADALAAAPRAFVLGARDPAHDFAVPSPVTRYAIDGTASFVTDFDTGERRYGTTRDIVDALRVFQAIDVGVMAWAPTCASDAPSHSRAVHEFLVMATACSKHGQHELHSTAQVPYLEAGLAAIAGGEDALRARHPYSLIYCPVAPLTHDGEMLDAYLALGRLDLPVMIMPMPVAGSTGPASLFANVCVANAEVLSAIVVYQLAHPGRPVVYSSATGTLDFRTGAFLGGTPEMGLMSAALVEMGRHYGLPATSAGCTSDAREPGPQAVLEKLITTLPPVLAGADIVVGLGEIEGDQDLVLEQLLVDAEIARACERIVRGVDADADPAFLTDIAEVGPGGHFLAQRTTRAAARGDEFLAPTLAPRAAYEAWAELGRPSMYATARERVREILAGPVVDPVPDATAAEVARILALADRELASDE